MGFFRPENWFERIKESWQPFLEDKQIIKPHEPTLKEKIREAHRQWEDARNYFNNVSEPGMVDYASHRLKAAERKYICLLNQFKQRESK